MRNYDLTVLFDVSKGEEEAKTLKEKITNVITKGGGTIYEASDISKTPLVNTFKKHTQAYLTRIQYSANNEVLAGLEREFQINEGIIRQVNTRMESVLNTEQIAELTKTK